MPLSSLLTTQQVRSRLTTATKKATTMLHQIPRLQLRRRPHRRQRSNTIAIKSPCYSSGAAPKLQSAAFFYIVTVFQCPVTGVELEVESRSWSLWLQFAFAFVKTGTSILASDVAGAVESGAAALENLYNAYHEEESDQKSFDLLLRAPLLLSSEQDELLGGLRREGFFEKSTYDPLRGQWVALGSGHAPH